MRILTTPGSGASTTCLKLRPAVGVSGASAVAIGTGVGVAAGLGVGVGIAVGAGVGTAVGRVVGVALGGVPAAGPASGVPVASLVEGWLGLEVEKGFWTTDSTLALTP